MASDKLENDAQCCFNKFDCSSFISKFSHFNLYLLVSFTLTHFKRSIPISCCLLPQCELLRTSCSAFPTTTQRRCDQWRWCQVQPLQKMSDRCSLLQKGGDVVATSQLVLHWKCDSPQTGCVQRAEVGNSHFINSDAPATAICQIQ